MFTNNKKNMEDWKWGVSVVSCSIEAIVMRGRMGKGIFERGVNCSGRMGRNIVCSIYVCCIVTNKNFCK